MTTSKTTLYPYPHLPVLVRADEAERLDSIGHVLLADSSTTGGALSSHRVVLARGADGAVPHRHDEASGCSSSSAVSSTSWLGTKSSPRPPATCSSCPQAWPTRSARIAARLPRR